jgi:hypothetical protein
MPDSSLPVRKQYEVTRVAAVVDAAGAVSRSVATSITLPRKPAGRVSERALMEFAKSLAVPAIDGALALGVAEGANSTKAPGPRVKIEIHGKVVAPASEVTTRAAILGFALGDGSVTLHDKVIVPPSPTGDPRLAQRRSDLPPDTPGK